MGLGNLWSLTHQEINREDSRARAGAGPRRLVAESRSPRRPDPAWCVSTAEQDVSLHDALHAGAGRIHQEVGSGSLKHRPRLDLCLDPSTSTRSWLCGSSTVSAVA
jgi:hypothetical protein